MMELVPRRFATYRPGLPSPPDLTVALIAQVTDALAYAHAQVSFTGISSRRTCYSRDEGGGMVRVKVADSV